ncbi:MAG: hypothetical protein GVY26_09060 [Bacteroidetes bacterium]|jgi:hypothetical protein|nr:hypothetical protein [Bacteroidota bacterium]
MELFAPPYINHRRSWHGAFPDYPHQSGVNDVVNADVIIGNLSVNCKGNGICKMLPRGSFVAQCSAVKSTLVKRGQHRLDVVFYTQECCDKIFNRVFVPGTFTVEESFQLPVWVRRALSFRGQRRIPAGSYPILQLRECALVRFELD